jgi:DoxX-like family
MSSRTQQIIGWILTGLLGLFLIGASGVPKFIDFPGKQEMFDHLGITAELSPVLGIIEVTVTLIFLIPRTVFVGAILLTGYLGGAVWAHVRVGDPWFFPIIIGVFVWVALGLRQPVIFTLALAQSPKPVGLQSSEN